METGKVYIMMEGRTCVLFKPEDFQVIDRFLGIELGGKTYTPLFSYYDDVNIYLKWLHINFNRLQLSMVIYS